MYEPLFWNIFDSNWNEMTGIIIGGRYGKAKDNLSIKMYLTLTPIVTGPRPAAVSAADYRLQWGRPLQCVTAVSPLYPV